MMYMPEIPVLRWQRQQDHKFIASLGYYQEKQKGWREAEWVKPEDLSSIPWTLWQA